MTDGNPPLTKIGVNHFTELRADRHVLYRCYSDKELLLYVGMTNHPEERFATHRASKIWWKYVDHITLQDYRNRKELEVAELVAIQEEKPKFNILNSPHAYDPVNTNPRKPRHLWGDASRFGTVQPDGGWPVDRRPRLRETLPCVKCQAATVYRLVSKVRGKVYDDVSCDSCGAGWTYHEWCRVNGPGFGGAA